MSNWWIVGTVSIGAFMAALDASIINVALPTLNHAFPYGIHRTAWISIAYLLTLTSLLAAFGSLADQYGRKRMYTSGFIVFSLGSVLCGLSYHLDLLIGARVIQAVGAAMLQANSVAIITQSVPAQDRGKAIGIQGSSQAIGLSLGPVLGGLLVTYFPWQMIFFMNIPIGILGTVLAYKILPTSPRQPKQPFDYIGALLLAPTLIFLTLGLTESAATDILSPHILKDFIIAAVTGLLFYLQESRHKNPILPLSLFKNRVFVVGNLTGLLSYAMMFGVLFLMPFYLEHALKHAPTEAGLLLTPVPIAMSLMAPLAGALADRFAIRTLTTWGLLALTAGSFILANLPNRWLITLTLVLIGIGMGLFTPPNNSSVMGAVSKDKLGLTGGILNMARSMGMSLGIAFSGTLYGSVLRTFKQVGPTPLPVVNKAFHHGFIGLGLLGILALLILRLGKKENSEKPA